MMMPVRRRDRPDLTLVEVAVTLAIVALIVVAPLLLLPRGRPYSGGNVILGGHVTLIDDRDERRIRYWEPDYSEVDPGW